MTVLLVALVVAILLGLCCAALGSNDAPTSDDLDPSVRARYESRRSL